MAEKENRHEEATTSLEQPRDFGSISDDILASMNDNTRVIARKL